MLGKTTPGLREMKEEVIHAHHIALIKLSEIVYQFWGIFCIVCRIFVERSPLNVTTMVLKI